MANQQKQPSRSRKQELRNQRREQARLAAQREEQRRRLMMIVGGVVGVALIAAVVLIFINSRDDGDDLPAVQAISAPEFTVPVNGLSIGDPNAPVSIVEYGDYQCPFCARAAEEGFRPMVDEYINTGQVHFTYVPMSFLGDESKAAAEAALCANDQGKFWQMHETIFANHSGENEGAFSRSRLNTMAENIGLNMDQFNACMDSGQHEGEVTNYANVAAQAGVTSTPTFVINNGEPVGWTTWEAMKSQIDAALGQ